MSDTNKQKMENADWVQGQLAIIIDEFRRDNGLNSAVLTEMLKNIAQRFSYVDTVLKNE